MIASLAIICQIAQATTPISHAMTLIGFSSYNSYTGNNLEFGQYVMVAMPVGILTAIGWFLVCRYVWRPDVSRLSRLDYDAIKGNEGPFSKQEKIAATIYLIVVVLWLASRYLQHTSVRQPTRCSTRFTSAIPPLWPSYCCISSKWTANRFCPTRRPSPRLPPSARCCLWARCWNWAPPWPTGTSASPPGSGHTIGVFCTGVSPFMFIVVLAAMSVILTNFMSNSVTCAICMAIAMPLSTSLYSGLISPVIAAIMITIGINFAFATAPATPPVAIAADSGWISAGRLFKYGAVAGLVGIAVMLAVGLPIANMVC